MALPNMQSEGQHSAPHSEQPPLLTDDGSITTPLTHYPEWNNVECPQCHSTSARRDPDTLDTFVDSSWYFLRYCDPTNAEQPFSKEAVAKWMKSHPEPAVDIYIGGIEHAILHLLYARFICRFLYHRGYAPSPEPFNKLLTQGMVLGKTYKDPTTGRYLMPNEVHVTKQDDGSEVPIMVETGETADMVWEKMSKSKFNGIDPDFMISRYGADVTRLASLFMAPPEQALEWDEGAVSGQSRWCERLRRLTYSVVQGQGVEAGVANTESVEGNSAADIVASVNRCVASVTECFETATSFNVAIAQLMKLSNVLNSENSKLHPQERKQGLHTLLIMLTPFAPHLASELLEQLQGEGDGGELCMQWPDVDEASLQTKCITVVVQIQGKKKLTLEVPFDVASSKEKLAEYVHDNDVVHQLLAQVPIQRTIVVPSTDGKRSSVVNFVLQSSKKKKKKK